MSTKTLGLLSSITAGVALATTSVIMASEQISPTPNVSADVIAQTQQNVSNDKQQIIKAIHLDDQPARPQAPTRVKDIVVEDAYAIAVILYGEHGGGMAALKKIQGTWKVVGGGGGAFDSRYLMEIGFPAKTAQSLMQIMEAQWSQ